MLQTWRSRSLATLALTAFLLAQPVVGCAVLCLLQRHHADEHVMRGMDGRGALLGGGACHTGVTDADHHTSLQTLSPMEPSREPVAAVVPGDRVALPDTVPALSPLVFRTVEPPPPRFA